MRWVVAALLLASTATTAEGKRVALVMGNAAYETPSARLSNPVRDAQAMAAMLREVGFEVIEALDASREAMERATNRFIDAIEAGDEALLYYSGHGMELPDGGNRLSNYLLPVDMSAEWDVVQTRLRSLSASEVQARMEGAGARVRILILDACRDNPFDGKSLSRGLGPMQPRGGLVAFAAEAGETASDNAGGANGLYTTHLLSALREPGISASEMFERVHAAVSSATGGRQRPAYYTSGGGGFVFRPSDSTCDPVTDRLFWESVRSSGNPADFEAYRRRCPGGVFVELAGTRLAELRGGPRPGGAGAFGTPVESVEGPVVEVDVRTGQVVNDLAELLRLAEGGNAEAQVELGDRIELGRGVGRDYAIAAAWYRMAAEQGYAAAQAALGYLYALGLGVELDYEEAYRLCRLAAEQGNPRGMNCLGVAYHNGEGVERDYWEAHRWYRGAAEQGWARAYSNLGVLHEYGYEVEQDYEEALRLYRLAADPGSSLRGRWGDRGDAAGQRRIGLMYQNGRGVEQDDEEAVRWLRLAASQGLRGAQSELGWMYQSGRGVEQDDEEAARWYRRAADQGLAYAQRALGSMYEKGRGVARSHGEAVGWYRRAADRDKCSEFLGDGSQQRYRRTGTWEDKCASGNRENRFARYYGFTLSRDASVTMDLTSSDVDTVLEVRRGPHRDGPLVERDDDGGDGTDSRISRSLGPGTYTIEATTFGADVAGSFTLALAVNER